MAYLDSKILILILAMLVLAWFFARYRKKLLVPLAVAFVIAALWSAYFRYEYTGNNILLFNRVNVYPLVLWTVGLTGLQLVSYKMPKHHHLAHAIVFYLVFLLAAEAVGYHFLNVRLNSNYTSLLSLGVIHAPPVMKLFYFFAGPVYLLLLDRVQYAVKSAAR